ncbi:MAG: hypothetical protein S4CHLAM7_07120 [Chlamydiae bacterium]|nr:hypothetical protein [Chlamydiota bacterium]
MNRTHKDWIIDNILYVDYWKNSSWFSIEDAINSLGSDFIFYKSSPGFISDWRWYKDLDSSNSSLFNEFAKEKYLKNLHNFLDYRIVNKERTVEENLQLLNLAKRIRELISDYLDTPTELFLNSVIDELSNLASIIKTFSELTFESLDCYINCLKDFKKGNSKFNFTHFHKWWGRGNHVLTFIKSKN